MEILVYKQKTELDANLRLIFTLRHETKMEETLVKAHCWDLGMI